MTEAQHPAWLQAALDIWRSSRDGLDDERISAADLDNLIALIMDAQDRRAAR